MEGGVNDCQRLECDRSLDCPRPLIDSQLQNAGKRAVSYFDQLRKLYTALLLVSAYNHPNVELRN